MSSQPKSFLAITVALAVYLVTPFFAGVVGTYDRRGPKIFFESHHHVLYVIGYSFFHDDKPRAPYIRERSWFYGMVGAPIPKRSEN